MPFNQDFLHAQDNRGRSGRIVVRRRASAGAGHDYAAHAGVEFARAVRTVVGLRPNPTVDTQIENVVGSGPYRGFNQAETTVWLAIPIELGGKRSARIAVADAQVHRSLLQSAMARADIRLQVR